MLSSPLDLKSHLHEPHFRMNVVPFVDALLIGLCIFILGSRYVVAPGVSVDLPKVSHLEGRRVVSVLTIKHDNMLIYEGRIYTMDEFHESMRKSEVRENVGSSVLLVKLNKDIAVQTFLDLCDVARESGFSQVQVASEGKSNL